MRWTLHVTNNYRLIVYSAIVLDAPSDQAAFDVLYVEGSAFKYAVDTYKNVKINRSATPSCGGCENKSAPTRACWVRPRGDSSAAPETVHYCADCEAIVDSDTADVVRV